MIPDDGIGSNMVYPTHQLIWIDQQVVEETTQVSPTREQLNCGEFKMRAINVTIRDQN
jgi:hypothetical protein